MGSLTDVPGIRVGHVQRDDAGWLTGVTVVLPPPGTVGSVDVQGGGPATQNVFTRNTAYGSANFDCFDDTTGASTKGTANTWQRYGTARNIGDTSSPLGLCRTH